jgi:hypothetical protein
VDLQQWLTQYAKQSITQANVRVTHTIDAAAIKVESMSTAMATEANKNQF